MSILDALRVQKAEQKSVRDLAMLPQQEIIRLAQSGQIPADVAPVVITEKARMAKEMANLQALMSQGQGKPPSVIEQAIMTNAQAETPQGPQAMQAPQGPAGTVPTPEMTAIGVGALPTGQSFQPQNFAGGGIVAFAGEGRSDVNLFDIVDQQQRQDPSLAEMFRSASEARDEAPGFRRQYASLADAIAAAREARSPLRQQSAEEIAFQEYLNQTKQRTGQQASESGWLRALEAGLGIMGGTSPYALTNIGKGAEAAVKGFGEDVKERRKGTLAEMASAAQQARQKRLEGLEDITAGERLYEKQLDRDLQLAAINRPTDMVNYVNNYVEKSKTAGDKRPESVIKDEGYGQYFKQFGMAQGKLDLGYFREMGDRINEATKEVQKKFSLDTDGLLSPANRDLYVQFQAAQKADKQDGGNRVAGIKLRELNATLATRGIRPLDTLPPELAVSSLPRTERSDRPGGSETPSGSRPTRPPPPPGFELQ